VSKKASAKAPDSKPVPIVVLGRNKRARHDYQVDETIEAGLALAGSEVKSIRNGRVNLIDSFADISKGEAWLHQMDVTSYSWAHSRNHEARRRRKLLMHRREIDRLDGKLRQKGYTLVPLQIYDKGGKIKVELALVTGKQDWDRREDLKKQDATREINRAMASRRR
jgi:SsrA-binding protein